MFYNLILGFQRRHFYESRMAEELKKKFQEMQEAKHGKREELKIDEFEWIEVRLRILNYLN